jgi:hypothetical protein
MSKLWLRTVQLLEKIQLHHAAYQAGPHPSAYHPVDLGSQTLMSAEGTIVLDLSIFLLDVLAMSEYEQRERIIGLLSTSTLAGAPPSFCSLSFVSSGSHMIPGDS